jgi:hypothetical protein
VSFLLYCCQVSNGYRKRQKRKKKSFFDFVWHWGLRVSSSRSPPTIEAKQTGSTWENRKKKR